MDLFEAMDTCRAIRRLKPDPVPDKLLQRLVHYATRAPSAGNTQLWGFLIVTAPEDRRFVADRIRAARADALPPDPGDATTRRARAARAFRQFILHFDEIPAILFPCVQDAYPPRGDPNPLFMWSTIYPATQNLLLAARALGLGAAMTTLHLADEPAIKAYFEIPEDVSIGATIPVGFPEGRYGPLNRKPDNEVTYWSRWGTTRS